MELAVYRPLRVLFVDNRPGYFLSHRLPLAQAIREAGYDVHVTTLTGGDGARIKAAGFTYHTLSGKRRDGSALTEAKVLARLCALYKQIRPDIAHHITLRSVLYGTIAGSLAGIPAIVQGITGLGYLFTSESAHVAVLRIALSRVMRLVLRHNNQILTFQNPDDRRVFEQLRLTKGVSTRIVKGAGVDTVKFASSPEPDGIPVVVLPGRMLSHKGVREFVEAARILKQRGIQARLALVGDVDLDNPATVTDAELHAWQEEGSVEWWGHRSDMPDVFASCHIVCLPSYREGIPKALIEAASCGRSIVTTDVPGCREIVRHGENGILVPSKDPVALASALGELILDSDKRHKMGNQGRQMVERDFAVEHVIRDTLEVYRSLLGEGNPHVTHRLSGPDVSTQDVTREGK